MTDLVEQARNRFPSASQGIYFDHASVGPISTGVADELRRVADLHEAAGFQQSWRDDLERVRGDLARLVGSDADSIAFTQNTSFGLSLVANGISWEPGDNVVLPEREFPSNYYPWLNLRDRGVEVRLVPAPAGHADVEQVRAAVDARTRVVAISAVQYSSGFRYDLRELGEYCRGSRALLVVDGTQCVGALRIDVAELAVDVLAVSSHKWLMGPPGAGFVHVGARARHEVRPSVVGWLTVPDPFAFDYDLRFPGGADRYEPGTENVIGNLGLGAAARLMLELTPEWVESRVIALTDRLVEGLLAQGYEILSVRRSGASSGILIFRDPGRAADLLFERLTDAGVRCAPRGGGIRLSPHCYNLDAEVDEVLAVLGPAGSTARAEP